MWFFFCLIYVYIFNVYIYFIGLEVVGLYDDFLNVGVFDELVLVSKFDKE